MRISTNYQISANLENGCVEEMKIRLLDESLDLSCFRDIRIESVCDTPASFRATLEEMKQKTTEDFQEQLSDHNKGDCFVGAFIDGTLVGVAALIHEPSVKLAHKAVIGAVFVKPGHRNKGIARKLITEIIQRCKNTGRIQFIKLSVTTSNSAAVTLYEKLGFAIYGTEPNATNIDGEYFDEHLMQLTL